MPALSCRGEIACRLVWSRNALKSNSDRRLDSNTFTITIRSSEPPLTQTGNRPTQRTFGMLLAISGLRSDFWLLRSSKPSQIAVGSAPDSNRQPENEGLNAFFFNASLPLRQFQVSKTN